MTAAGPSGGRAKRQRRSRLSDGSQTVQKQFFIREPNAFFEYGKGSCTTSRTFDNAASVNGGVNAWYMGAGLVAKMEFLSTAPGRFYAEGSVHMGQLHNEHDSRDLQDAIGRIAKFGMDSPYHGLHAGAAYEHEFAGTCESTACARPFCRPQGKDSSFLRAVCDAEDDKKRCRPAVLVPYDSQTESTVIHMGTEMVPTMVDTDTKMLPNSLSAP